MSLKDYKTVKERNIFLEKKLGISLQATLSSSIDDDASIHCENRFGSVVMPVGVAGPFVIRGAEAKGEKYIPLATTEGALVASVNRGAKACHANGITVSATRVGVTRGPVLKAHSLPHAVKTEQWINENIGRLGEVAKEASGHIKLMDVITKIAGRNIYVRLSFDTDLAMGMNMATIAAELISQHIAKQTKAAVVSVAGNFDIDKKPGWMNSIYGRGYVVNAEAAIDRETVASVLKTDAKKMEEIWKAKCMVGSALSGSIGFNAHHANIVAAIYAATGQDLAHVVEGSLGMTIIEEREDGLLYINVTCPSILVGTVGGGTNLKTQKEAMAILKIKSPQGLAEVVGAAVLAGELSLLASLSAGSLASTHKRLGR